MRFSAPVYRLKRRAKRMSREEGIPLHDTLDRVAREEGFADWSLLASRVSTLAPARKLLARLGPGDLVLLAARPGHGKTTLGIELLIEATRAGRRGTFFTLEYTPADLLAHLALSGVDGAAVNERFEFDDSDALCADHVIDRLGSAARGSVAVIDYLQLLDQRRETPPLEDQIRDLRRFARNRGIVLVFIAQVDRAFPQSGRELPGPEDIRLPNPLDLTLFDAACYLNDGEIAMRTMPGR